MIDEVIQGTDIHIAWAINTSSGDSYPLEGKNISVYMINGRSTIQVDDFSVNGNTVSWIFRGKDQKTIGNYMLRIIERANKGRMITIDRCNAFRIVFTGYCANEAQEGLVDEEYNLTLSSEVSVIRMRPVIPVIGDNGNWWIDGEDTGKIAYNNIYDCGRADTVYGGARHLDCGGAGGE